jgi:cyclohexyl-isocyanide hydratase
MPLQIGFLIFPEMMPLDMVGPFEVFTKMPDTKLHLVWKSLAPVTVAGGLQMLPTTTFTDCPALDVICVPGSGMNPLLNDEETLEFVRDQANGARYITSVCTGSLVLGAAGLLKGKRAATHWMSREMLSAFGAIPVADRVVIHGNVITGGGVTAGVDFGITLAAELFGPEIAKTIQLAIEYNPAPPFDTGAPERAGEKIVAAARANAAKRQADRQLAVQRAAAKLREPELAKT